MNAVGGVWLGSKAGDWWKDNPSINAESCSKRPLARAGMCTRPVGHRGRHIATIGGGTIAIAAWPGSDEPTVYDLAADDVIRDANGDPVRGADPSMREWFAARVPAKRCRHYIAASEARAGYTQCERCAS